MLSAGSAKKNKSDSCRNAASSPTDLWAFGLIQRAVKLAAARPCGSGLGHGTRLEPGGTAGSCAPPGTVPVVYGWYLPSDGEPQSSSVYTCRDKSGCCSLAGPWLCGQGALIQQQIWPLAGWGHARGKSSPAREVLEMAKRHRHSQSSPRNFNKARQRSLVRVFHLPDLGKLLQHDCCWKAQQG